MRTTFEKPSEIAGLSAKIKVTQYKAMPIVRNGEFIAEVTNQFEGIVPLHESLLTHDTCRWTGYYLNHCKLADYAGRFFNLFGNYGVTLLNVE